jgi:hypothetical protein
MFADSFPTAAFMPDAFLHLHLQMQDVATSISVSKNKKAFSSNPLSWHA